MYQPAHFRLDDPTIRNALLKAHPLATLVVATPDGLVANHLPLMLDVERNVLRGHVARANPLWQSAIQGSALAVFQGPQAYISPSGYPSKREHGKVVPTWNYAVVHVHGPLRFFDDVQQLHALVSTLTKTHEAAQAQPWKPSDAPTDFIAANLRAIVGLELTIERIDAKWKVSQNRNEADAQGAAAALEAGGHADSAALIRAHRPG
ncbi:FMN-binding negative transcriptional regulator [Rivibacter subsaxonicus]|uniref:PaiB family negative transcriptional regulator n=1 Tax=Rivibacter subsaxonicus TaxID=457575 RepID=A0A4Q7VGV7_9BURK|nr:FMN-binding negative transcriptional regulator [Rivibacter subsaxonicus]RZT95283.1 PaiB family negative transcriptional regulator [Rivibacter subsaxonicus]